LAITFRNVFFGCSTSMGASKIRVESTRLMPRRLVTRGGQAEQSAPPILRTTNYSLRTTHYFLFIPFMARAMIHLLYWSTSRTKTATRTTNSAISIHGITQKESEALITCFPSP